jgi:hypothetical protein
MLGNIQKRIPITYNYICENVDESNYLGPEYTYLDVDYRRRGERAIEGLVEYGFDFVLLDTTRRNYETVVKTLLRVVQNK